jgi:3-methyladenine DNA glycosylase AlkD
VTSPAGTDRGANRTGTDQTGTHWAGTDLAGQIRADLRAAADPVRAPRMQAYMRSTMPYLGVPLPATRLIAGRAIAAHPPSGVADLAHRATDLWRTAEYREERYAATELTVNRIAVGRLEMLPVWTEMIVTGAWWDHVDAVSPRIGELLLAHPTEMLPLIRRWAVDPGRWLRRSSIICQLGLARRTDLDLLTEVIVANLADREFFVRKAIGWALRQYARTDLDWVRAFVLAHEASLSPLSRREALKHLS